MKDRKLLESIETLKKVLVTYEKDRKNEVNSLAVSKAFEVAFEYAWKFLKRKVSARGKDAFNPRKAIRSAVELEIIFELETWESFLNARNLSVYDYIGLESDEFLEIIYSFESEVSRLFSL
ncbi:MAG: nucleotidyltransferase substrate binding protein [Bdellovibrionota bacterium]